MAEFEGVRGLWEQLAREATIFQSFAWSQLAAACFARREQPYVICCESDSGAAIIPAVIRRDGSMSLLGEKLFDYRNILHAGERAVLAQAWRQLCELDRPFQLTALRGEQNRLLWQGAQPRPFAHAPCLRACDLEPLRSVYAPELCPVEHAFRETEVNTTTGGSVPTDWQHRFLNMHSRLWRRARRLAHQPVEFKQHAGSERQLMRFILETKGRQPTPSRNLLQDRMRREFIARIAADPASRCDLYTYETNSDLVAALITFRDDALRYCYTIYYDPRWSNFSPGQLLLFEVAARSVAEGLECDFMTGEYPYKNRLATARVPLFKVEAGPEALAQIFPSGTAEQGSVQLSGAGAAKSDKDGSRPAA